MLTKLAPTLIAIPFLLTGLWLYRNPDKLAPDWAWFNQSQKDRRKFAHVFAGLLIFMSVFMIIGIVTSIFAEPFANGIGIIVASSTTWLLVRRIGQQKEDVIAARAVQKRSWLLLVIMCFGTVLTIFEFLIVKPSSVLVWLIPAVAVSIAWIVVIRVWKKELVR